MPPARPSSRPTIVQVASRAGVSIKTVSRVTNGEPNVSPELRARVEAAIRGLDYHPSLAARSLAGRRSFLLALAWDNPSPGYLLNLQDGARAACHERGFRLLFHPCDARSPTLAAELLGLRDDPGVEGLILAPPLSGHAALLARLAADRLPHALVGPPMAARGGVRVDDEAAAATAMHHLLRLGHRRIAFVTGHPDHVATAQRRRGYESALRGAGLPVSPELIAPGEFTFDSGRRAAQSLLARRRGRPTAILASNDDMAAGVIAEAHALGLELPRELSVVGFDDAPLAPLLWPPLTTLRQPIEAMAGRATQGLLDQLQGVSRAPPPDVVLDCPLVVRASACPPP